MPSESKDFEVCRRTFLRNGLAGVGLLALNSLLDRRLLASTGVVNPLHHPAKAKRVIFLYQAGGPSHLETFDYKPKLAEMTGKPMPDSFTAGQQIAQLQGQRLTCFGPQHPFQKFGKSGQEMCSLFPHIGSVADDICIVRSMWTEQINHDPAHTLMNTGSIITGRPSMGSWVFYGLGAETDNLPGFVVLMSAGKGGQMQPIAARQWSSGILPSKFQGVKLNSFGDGVLQMYGARPGDGSFASNCLLARRLAERGVRFIQLYHSDWDHHSGVKANVVIKAQETDRPTAALIQDLKQRGMLDDTLVVWGGEFGRTPMSQGDGRDHHIKGFSFLLAGGGIKGGMSYGATDELGYAAVENAVAVPDFHATMLHLLGIDHKRLTVKFQGLDARLTGIAGNVVKGILA